MQTWAGGAGEEGRVRAAVDVGQGRDLEAVEKRALRVGAARCYVIDARRDLAYDYVLPSLKANALCEGLYPLSAALSRPLISKLLVDMAEREGATAVAHGCTGRGNDQVHHCARPHELRRWA